MRLLVSLLAALLVASGAAACGSARRLVGEPPPLPPPCADPALHARAAVRDPAVSAPTPVELFVPPLPAPRDVAGRTVRLDYRVDSVGRIDTASIAVAGSENAAYNAKLRALVVRRMRFRPAQLGGCAVSAWGRLEYTLGP